MFDEKDIYKRFALDPEDRESQSRDSRLIRPLENNLVILNTRVEPVTSRHDANQNLEKLGLRAYSIPQVARYKASKELTDKIWKNRTPFHSASNLSIGNTNQGNKVVVVSHNQDHPANTVEFYKDVLADPSKIIKVESFGKSYVKLDTKAFEKLLDREDGKEVIVLDYDTASKQMPGDYIEEFESWKPMSLDQALSHPLVIPFFQTEENATKYLQKAVEINEFEGLDDYKEYDKKLVFINPLIQSDTPIVAPLKLTPGNIESVLNTGSALFHNNINYMCEIKDIEKFKKEFKRYKNK